MTHMLQEASKHNRLAPSVMLVAIVLLAAWRGAASGGYFTSERTLAAHILAVLALTVSVPGAVGTGSPR